VKPTAKYGKSTVPIPISASPEPSVHFSPQRRFGLELEIEVPPSLMYDPYPYEAVPVG
jgi:hypothetical protein